MITGNARHDRPRLLLQSMTPGSALRVHLSARGCSRAHDRGDDAGVARDAVVLALVPVSTVLSWVCRVSPEFRTMPRARLPDSFVMTPRRGATFSGKPSDGLEPSTPSLPWQSGQQSDCAPAAEMPAETLKTVIARPTAGPRNHRHLRYPLSARVERSASRRSWIHSERQRRCDDRAAAGRAGHAQLAVHRRHAVAQSAEPTTARVGAAAAVVDHAHVQAAGGRPSALRARSPRPHVSRR
jgi:hypothetical protein